MSKRDSKHNTVQKEKGLLNPVQDTNTAQVENQAEATISQRMELGVYIQSGFDFCFVLFFSFKIQLREGTGKEGDVAKLIYNHHFTIKHTGSTT